MDIDFKKVLKNPSFTLGGRLINGALTSVGQLCPGLFRADS